MMQLVDLDVIYAFVNDKIERETGAYTRGKNKAFNIVKSALHSECTIPTITPESLVRHGRWVEHTGEDAGFHFCSNCKRSAFNYEENREVVEVLSDYCPHCGAKMDLEE